MSNVRNVQFYDKVSKTKDMITNVFTVIFDMDEVLVDWEKGFALRFKEKFPHLEYKSVEEREHWWLPNNYSEDIREAIGHIAFEEEFFLNLHPKEGALEAVKWVFDQGFGMAICTSPLWTRDAKIISRCIAEKILWIDKYFGELTPLFNPESKLQITMTHDKTLVHGDILIDDRPEITGKCQPTWEHLLFDNGHKFNDGCLQERINWTNYQSVIQKHFQKWQQKKKSHSI